MKQGKTTITPKEWRGLAARTRLGDRTCPTKLTGRRLRPRKNLAASTAIQHFRRDGIPNSCRSGLLPLSQKKSCGAASHVLHSIGVVVGVVTPLPLVSQLVNHGVVDVDFSLSLVTFLFLILGIGIPNFRLRIVLGVLLLLVLSLLVLRRKLTVLLHVLNPIHIFTLSRRVLIPRVVLLVAVLVDIHSTSLVPLLALVVALVVARRPAVVVVFAGVPVLLTVVLEVVRGQLVHGLFVLKKYFKFVVGVDPTAGVF
mmetsp:Transcript_15621/g.34450  ORF Transcript_15621/g.34450 Transcript_15621/m.34450 type:complete len:255 (-) Transcript_15621:1079-1843(-)